MPRYLNPRGRATYGIALCCRCATKRFLDELVPDPNSPGLMVCREDIDDLDPYRMAPRPADPIALLFYRPDVSLATSPIGILTEDAEGFLITEDGEEWLVP